MDNTLETTEEFNNYFETICEVSPVGLFCTNDDGSVLYVNKKYEDLTGKDFDELKEDGWIKTIHQRDAQKVLAEWQMCIKNKKKFIFEYRIINGDNIIWVLGQATPINNSRKGFVGTITNINKRKKLLDELIEIQEKTYT